MEETSNFGRVEDWANSATAVTANSVRLVIASEPESLWGALRDWPSNLAIRLDREPPFAARTVRGTMEREAYRSAKACA